MKSTLKTKLINARIKMNKLFTLLLCCLLFSSCAKEGDGFQNADYRFQVTCGDCTIQIVNGNSIQSYNVRGYQSIPFYHYLPVITVSLWTNYDQDRTQVRFVGSGYNNTLFDGFLYYNDPARVIQFNL
jgi:hypothetical protein